MKNKIKKLAMGFLANVATRAMTTTCRKCGQPLAMHLFDGITGRIKNTLFGTELMDTCRVESTK